MAEDKDLRIDLYTEEMEKWVQEQIDLQIKQLLYGSPPEKFGLDMGSAPVIVPVPFLLPPQSAEEVVEFFSNHAIDCNLLQVAETMLMQVIDRISASRKATTVDGELIVALNSVTREIRSVLNSRKKP